MKSFIPWIGGKSQLVKKITAEFPQDFGRYIEVFGGGASVLFSADKHAKFEVYNDANGDLVNLFRCIKYHREELQREIRYYLNSREMFLDIRQKLSCSGFTDIQRAAMFYVLVKTSFGADARSYGCFNKEIKTDCFADVEKRISSVEIEHKDFEALKAVRPSRRAFLLRPAVSYHGKALCREIFRRGSLPFERCFNSVKRAFYTVL